MIFLVQEFLPQLFKFRQRRIGTINKIVDNFRDFVVILGILLVLPIYSSHYYTLTGRRGAVKLFILKRHFEQIIFEDLFVEIDGEDAFERQTIVLHLDILAE